ncbi:MAG: Lipocalin-like domain, partial [Alphaproteobacteria bacterium]|nr:Lipocalin-like domain [Alphaproteobacteria bacterium]
MPGRVMAISMTLALLILESSVSRLSADDRDKLLGTWKLLSAVSQNLATGEKADIYKGRPLGFITYGADG